uniref:CUB domain-containing protein n=1 Tax=Meloidogyne hapla TaxID=6305 RepID=A0A1I8BHV6_MELHA
MSLASNNQTKLRKLMVIKKKGYGFISSTGYPKDGYERVKCAVNLEAKEGSGLVINIKFLDLDLEPRYSRSDQCLRDYIVLTFIDREGLEHTSERICGNQKPELIQSMQSKLRVLFIATSPPLQHYLPNTNTSKRWKGFKLRFDFVKEETISVITSQFNDQNKRYRSECGGANLPNTLSENIQSPGFPSTYPPNVNCFWLIRVVPNKRIYIKIIDLELSPTLDYERAILSLIDGYSFGISSEEENQKINENNQKSSKILNFGSPRRDTKSISFYGNKSYYTEEGSLSYLSESNRVIIQFMTSDGPTQNQLAEYKKNNSPIGFRLLWTEVLSLIATSSDFPLNTDNENSVSQEENLDVITSDLCPGFVCLGGYFCLDSQSSVCVERNRLCINETLRCDGISNCAENDDSDEQYC